MESEEECDWKAPANGRIKDSDYEPLEIKNDPSSSQKLVSRIVFRLLFLAFVSTAAYVFLFSQLLSIQNIQISGTNKIDRNKLLKSTQSVLAGKRWLVLPKDNYFLASRGSIEEMLKAEYRRIKTINVTKKFPETLAIELEERQALMLWCSQEKCFVLDEEGRAFQEADFASKELQENNLEILADSSNQSLSLGERILVPEYMNFVLSLREELNKKLGIEIENKFSTPSRAADEVWVSTKQGWSLIFSSNVSVERSLRALQLLLNKEITVDGLQFLEYIDLRSINKVYYKYKGEEKTDEEITGENQAEKQDGAEKKESEDNKTTEIDSKEKLKVNNKVNG